MNTTTVPFQAVVATPPPGPLIALNINYFLAFRYSLHHKNTTSDSITAHAAVYLGIHQNTLLPVHMVRSPSSKQVPRMVLKGGDTSVAGTGSGVKILLAGSNKWTNTFIPHIEVLRRGAVPHHKETLWGVTARPADEMSGVQREADAARQCDRLESGHPLLFPAGDGFISEGRDVHLDHSPLGMTGRPFALPVFAIQSDVIPARASHLLAEWCSGLPNDLIHPQTALMKILQWIWLMEDDAMRSDGIDKPSTESLYIYLEDWIRCGHEYETFHQVHRLVSYIHPGRFITRLMTHRPGKLRRDHDRPPNPLLEELLIVLRPLAESPLGMALPCFHRGSMMPDLSVSYHRVKYLPRTEPNLEQANQPDWRSFSFTSLPVAPHFDEATLSAEGAYEDFPMRRITIPHNWLPAYLQTLHPQPVNPLVLPEVGSSEKTFMSVVTDIHMGEPGARLSPMVGPTNFVGNAPMPPSAISAIARLMETSPDLALWTMRGPHDVQLGDREPSESDSSEPRRPPTPPPRAQKLHFGFPADLAQTLVEWHAQRNRDQLAKAVERGLGVHQLGVDPLTGDISLPEEEPSPPPPPPLPPWSGSYSKWQTLFLAREFINTLKKEEEHLWGGFPTVIRAWIEDPSSATCDQLADAARAALLPLLEVVAPLQITTSRLHFNLHVKSPQAPDGTDKLPLLPPARLRPSLETILQGHPEQKDTVDILLLLVRKNPPWALEMIRSEVTPRSVTVMPRLVRALLAENDAFLSRVDLLMEEKFEEYDEVGGLELVVPLAGRHEPPDEEDEEEEAAPWVPEQAGDASVFMAAY